jgi:hypothetical protein
VKRVAYVEVATRSTSIVVAGTSGRTRFATPRYVLHRAAQPKMSRAICDSEGEDEEVLVRERPSQSSIISWAAKQIDAVADGLFDGADERSMGSTGMLTSRLRTGHSPPPCIDTSLIYGSIKHNLRQRFEMLPGDCLALILARTRSHNSHPPIGLPSRAMQILGNEGPRRMSSIAKRITKHHQVSSVQRP